MTDQTTETYSPEEVQAAEAVLRRKSRVDMKAKIDLLPQARDVVGHDGFEPLLDAARAFRDAAPSGSDFWNHAQAMVVGMENLQTDVARTVVSAAAAATTEAVPAVTLPPAEAPAPQSETA